MTQQQKGEDRGKNHWTGIQNNVITQSEQQREENRLEKNEQSTGTYGTITKDVIFVSLEFWKEKSWKSTQKKKTKKTCKFPKFGKRHRPQIQEAEWTPSRISPPQIHAKIYYNRTSENLKRKKKNLKSNQRKITPYL